MSTLTHCPFCGGVAELQFSGSCYAVTCRQCGASGPTPPLSMDPHCDPGPAIDDWENRSVSDGSDCPFCGSQGLVDDVRRIECDDCGAAGPAVAGDDPDREANIWAAWRRRV